MFEMQNLVCPLLLSCLEKCSSSFQPFSGEEIPSIFLIYLETYIKQLKTA